MTQKHEVIGSGAEAVIYRCKSADKDSVLKHRPCKGYRHEAIDKSLRKSRTKREYKVLEKMYALGLGPKPLSKCDKEMKIHYDYVDGDKLRDVLHKNSRKWAAEIGKNLAKMHKNDIIHGDLTTSNMIVKEDLKFIDFGLSFFSSKHEDKAVDLHLLRRALESKHHEIFDEVFKIVLQEYEKELKDEAKDILKRLEQVEARGRNKH
jgi:Kae1-associated kinase Bud32